MAYITVTTPIDVVAPGDGKLSLREAITQANGTGGPDTIVFAANIEGTTLTLTQGELAVTQDLTIDGDKDNNGSAVTIDGNGSSRILHIVGGSTDVVVTDTTLERGRTPNDYRESGGAVLLEGGSLAMNGATIRDSECGDYGVYGSGGGIYASSGSRLKIINSDVSGNKANGGGGIFAGSNVTLSIASSQITGNQSYDSAGGIWLLDNSTLTIEGSLISGNSGDGNYKSWGGGLLIRGSTASISRSTFSRNYATYGGGISSGNSRLTISDSTFANNVTSNSEDGGSGAAVSASGDLTIQSSTITGNTNGSGYHYASDGVVDASGNFTILSSIVAGNFYIYSSSSIRRPSGIVGTITQSDGHNLFDTAVTGMIPGDRGNVPATTIFATIDAYGGGKLAANRTVPLKSNVLNPALSGADPLVDCL